MSTATLTILVAVLSQASALRDIPQNIDAATIHQQQTKPTVSSTAPSQRERQRTRGINRRTTGEQRKIPDTELRRYRGRADGSIEMLDAKGRVLEVYPKGHFMLHMPSAETLKKLEMEREAQRNYAERTRQRIKQGRLDKEAAAEAATQARRDAEDEREKAATIAAREASAIRLLDRRTGKYVRAIPSTGNTAAGGKDGAAAIRLWDARRHRYVRAVPLESPKE